MIPRASANCSPNIPFWSCRDSSAPMRQDGRTSWGAVAPILTCQVFLAVEAQRRAVDSLKDVDGVYEIDPADPKAHPRRFAELHYQDALRVAGKLIQPKAVSYLAKHNADCEVAALALPCATRVYGADTAHATLSPNRSPVDVVILGCGTVGFGVYQRLCAHPNLYRVIGILVREPAGHEAAGIPSALLHTQSETLDKLRPDLVIDALPGIEPSYAYVASYLAEGVDAVSANKALIAQYVQALSEMAETSGATLKYSAAVGGAAPMLETVDRAREGGVKSLTAVLNGTCNYLLDACASGKSLDSAIQEAQRLGLAEADPTEDLSAQDAVRKSRILARHAFGAEIRASEVEVFGEPMAEAARLAVAEGRRLRQLATVTESHGELALCVSFEAVSPDSPFYSLAGEWNALTITLADSETLTVSGRGAGRWPTTEAVMADAFETVRLRRYANTNRECGLAARLASM